MPTVNSRELVNEIIANNGNYLDDPPVIRIVQYNNSFNGDVGYGLIYHKYDWDKYNASQFIINPKVIFERK